MKSAPRYLLLFFGLVLVYFWDVPLRGLHLAIGDGFTYFYPMAEVVAQEYRALRLPLWNPYMFSGFPLMATMQHGVFYPPGVLPQMVLGAPLAYDLKMMAHLGFAGWFTFLYARRIGMQAAGAVLSGGAFALLGRSQSQARASTCPLR